MQVSMHFLLSIFSDSYGHISFLAVVEPPSAEDMIPLEMPNHLVNAHSSPSRHHSVSSKRANATFVLLCRNSDVNGVVASIQSVEDRFNKDYRYPWVLLNDEPFTEDFKRYAPQRLRRFRLLICPGVSAS